MTSVQATSMREVEDGLQLMSIAPMMDWTDVHYRQLARIMTKHTWLWTEMVVDKTIIHTPNLDVHLWFPPEQHPIVLQVGGSDPDSLRQAAVKAAEYGYDEINLNCGCPSDRVAGAGCFGATLMLQPELVAKCMTALQEGCPNTPVTVKCRLGVDDVDSYAELCNFISVVSSNAPVTHFIIHARKCLLKGLNPHQNRSIPPLRYGWVYALRRDFPHLEFSLNGGIQSAEEVKEVLGHDIDGSRVHGVMVGRAAFNDPWHTLAQADTIVFGAADNPAKSRRQVIEEYCKYGDAVLGRWGTKQDGSKLPNVRAIIKPILNLFHGARRSKKWKSTIDQLLLQRPDSVSGVLNEVMPILEAETLDDPPGGTFPGRPPLELFTAPMTGPWPPPEVPPPFGREVPRPVAAASSSARDNGDARHGGPTPSTMAQNDASPYGGTALSVGKGVGVSATESVSPECARSLEVHAALGGLGVHGRAELTAGTDMPCDLDGQIKDVGSSDGILQPPAKRRTLEVTEAG